uniref:Uncharacterized protein n=1 Tax=Vespula pensylvanica TaxID=30213 RepID=A0A834NHZ7_VESPE|nr:hypothetical protein H0235_013487 [Vespula pensylvanica]
MEKEKEQEEEEEEEMRDGPGHLSLDLLSEDALVNVRRRNRPRESSLAVMTMRDAITQSASFEKERLIERLSLRGKHEANPRRNSKIKICRHIQTTGRDININPFSWNDVFKMLERDLS